MAIIESSARAIAIGICSNLSKIGPNKALNLFLTADLIAPGANLAPAFLITDSGKDLSKRVAGIGMITASQQPHSTPIDGGLRLIPSVLLGGLQSLISLLLVFVLVLDFYFCTPLIDYLYLALRLCSQDNQNLPVLLLSKQE